MKRTIYRLLACLLLVCMFVTGLPTDAMARNTKKEQTQQKEKEKEQEGKKLGTVKKEDVPKSVGHEQAKQKGHKERRYDLEGEDYNKVVFDNEDNTRTEYYFDYPVKYKDKQGKMQDIKMKLKKDKKGYSTEANSIVTTFSNELTDGVHLTEETLDIRLVPEFVESATAQIDEAGEVVTYEIDEDTVIEYSLTYLGFKEDIVVQEYNGVTEYPFVLYTEGLQLQKIQEEWFLVDADGKVKAAVGDLIVFTADERNNTLGEIRVETIEENECYRMVLVLDDEYLRSPETAYPIRIDPTIEVNYEKKGAGAIEDVTINSAMGSMGNSGSIFIGKRTSGGIARTLMRFPALDMSAVQKASCISKATVEIRDLMCESTAMTVSCHVFTGNTWKENTATWSNTSPNSYQSKALSSNTVSYANGKKQATAHRYSFDITEAVIGWYQGNYNINKGILFKAAASTESSSSQLYKTFASYNRASYKPSLSITYLTGTNYYEGTHYLNNKETGHYLGQSGTTISPKSGMVATLGNSIRWELHKISNYYVIQQTSNRSKYLCSVGSNTDQLGYVTISDGTIPTNCQWEMTQVSVGEIMLRNVGTNRYLVDTGTTVKALSKSSTVGLSTYRKNVWRVVSAKEYGSGTSYTKQELPATVNLFSSITLDVNESVTITTNSNASKYLWASSSDFTYSVSGNAAKINGTTITGYTGGTATVTATHKVTGAKRTFSVKTYKTAIIVVPGIGGSDLSYKDGRPFFNAEVISSLDWKKVIKIFMDSENTDTIVPAEQEYGFRDTYKTIMEKLKSQFGKQMEVRFFAYDWRLSNLENGKKLKESLVDQYEKIIFVSHSMGGLVTSAYLSQSDANRNKVKQAFFLGTPFLGAPMAPFLMMGGDIEEFYDLDSSLATFFANLIKENIMTKMESMYELIPTEACERLGISTGQYMGKKSYEDMCSMLLPDEDSPFHLLYELFFNQAKDFHAKLWISGNKHVSTLVDSYYFAGTGESTICGYYANTRTINRSTAGDGVVPVWSATIGNSSSSRVRTYVGITHMGLVKEAAGAIDDVCALIQGGD